MRKLELLFVLHVILLCSHMLRHMDYVVRTAPIADHCATCSP